MEPKLLPFIDFFFGHIHITTHVNKISGIMLEPLYTLLSGNTVNVGNIVFQNIMMRKQMPNRTLCYLGLIWRISEAAGVDMSVFERNFEMGPAIELPEVYIGRFNFASYLPLDTSETSHAPPRSEQKSVKPPKKSGKRPRSEQVQTKPPPPKKSKSTRPTPSTAQTRKES